MGDSDEDWWEKDIDNFSVDLKRDLPKESFEETGNLTENEAPSMVDKERLYNLMKGEEYKNAGQSKTVKNEEKKDSSMPRSKIPFTKLAAISKMTPLKAFMELNNLKGEFLQTIKSRSINKNLFVNACIALLQTFKTPFEEHKYVLMREIKEIVTFWSHLSKYVSEVTAQEEYNDGWIALFKVCMRFSDISPTVRETIKLIMSKITKEMTSDPQFCDKFKTFLDSSSCQTVSDTILPTSNDLLTDAGPEISENIIKGAFPSTIEYRQTHMSLLKEDFLAPIRQSLVIYRDNYPEMLHEGLVENIYVIPRVQLGHGYTDRVREYVDLKFNENPERKRKVSRQEKRFLPGTLLIFASDIKMLNDLILATVLPGDENLREQGIIPVTIVKCKAGHKIFDGQLMLIEPTTYFEPYNHVYNVLSNSTEPDIPMKEYIVDVKKLIRPPRYLKRLKTTNIEHKGHIFDLSDQNSFPSGSDLDMDDSQMEAYKSALTQELSLVQGPPGTGKTHIGLQILTTLLRNTIEKILIVCYTNHALDQTLTGLLQETDKIVRFGEQSKNDVMQQFTFKEVGMNRDHLVDSALKRLYWKTKQERNILSDQFYQIQVQEDVVEQSILEKLQLEMLSVTKRFFELNQLQTFLRIQDKRVFGMTTTFAARCHALLQLLEIPIVLIEEAGEILESHIVTSLTPNTEQLILIGDHYQLKPNTSTYLLAKDFKLNISLFERMINNEIPYTQLKNQHRMHPCISELIRDTIYPELLDAPNVSLYPNVKGMSKNLYFLTHNHLEIVNMEDFFNETSKRNKFEADFLIDLCEYLIQNGSQPENITILTMYQGQRRLLHETRNQKDRNGAMKGVRITVVDNFQGEENNIILLSLVRSNTESKIGFVGIRNRVCVALSRAKEGLFIVGNMEMLKKASSIWKTINEKLEKLQAIGSDIREAMIEK